MGVKLDCENIFTGEVEVRRQLKEKWRVSPSILSDARGVDPHGGGSHRCFEIDEHSLAARFLWKLEMAAINRNQLVRLLLEAMPGQAHVCARDCNPLQPCVGTSFGL